MLIHTEWVGTRELRIRAFDVRSSRNANPSQACRITLCKVGFEENEKRQITCAKECRIRQPNPSDWLCDCMVHLASLKRAIGATTTSL